MMMVLNTQAERLIKSFEKLRLKAYHGAADHDGIYTIGWGHVITGNESPDLFKVGDLMSEVVITKERADELFEEDIAKFIRGIILRLDIEDREKLTYNQFGALVSFAYNIGLGNFKISAVRRTINYGDAKNAWHGFRSFVRSGGKRRNGLVRRRAAEAALYRDDIELMEFFLKNARRETITKAEEYIFDVRRS